MVQTIKSKKQESQDQKVPLIFISYLFDNREQILVQFDELIDQKIITPKDLVEVFKYSLEVMGISGNEITKIVVKYIVK